MQEPPPFESRAHRRQPRQMRIAIALLALAVLVGAVLILLGRSGTDQRAVTTREPSGGDTPLPASIEPLEDGATWQAGAVRFEPPEDVSELVSERAGAERETLRFETPLGPGLLVTLPARAGETLSELAALYAPRGERTQTKLAGAPAWRLTEQSGTTLTVTVIAIVGEQVVFMQLSGATGERAELLSEQERLASSVNVKR